MRYVLESRVTALLLYEEVRFIFHSAMARIPALLNCFSVAISTKGRKSGEMDSTCQVSFNATSTKAMWGTFAFIFGGIKFTMTQYEPTKHLRSPQIPLRLGDLLELNPQPSSTADFHPRICTTS